MLKRMHSILVGLALALVSIPALANIGRPTGGWWSVLIDSLKRMTE